MFKSVINYVVKSNFLMALVLFCYMVLVGYGCLSFIYYYGRVH